MNKIALFSLIIVSGTYLYPMEAPAKKPARSIVSLKNRILTQLAIESDIENLQALLKDLPVELAPSLLAHALSYNYELHAVARCELIATVRKREGLSAKISAKLEQLESSYLFGEYIDATILMEKSDGEEE